MRAARIALVFGVIALAGCGHRQVAEPVAPPRLVLLPAPSAPEQVRVAVVGALAARGWAVEGEAGGTITARLEHRRAVVRVAIGMAADRVTLQVLEAVDAGRNQERWLANLEESIRDACVVPAPTAPVALAAPLAVAPPPTTVYFGSPREVPSAKAALQRALGMHKWVVEADEAAGFVARLAHRRGLVRVRCVTDGAKVVITYVDSQDLAFDGAGHSDEYERWMRNLSEAIRNHVR